MAINYWSKCDFLLKLVLLLIIPVLIVIYQAGITQNIYFSDPDYAYILNGLNINISRLPLYSDHPGVPLTMLSAVGIKFIYWFSGHGGDIQTDVITNPSYYEIRLRYILFYLIIASTVIIGYFIYKKTKNIYLAILFQAIPFIYDMSIEIVSTRFMPDALLIMVMQIFIFAFLNFIINSIEKKNIVIDKWLFPVICGFGLSVKLIFLPVIFLPILLLGTDFKKIFRFLIVTLLSFVVFTSPVCKQYQYMLNWIYSLFIHSGTYGGGSATIIDTSKYINNIYYIITNNSLMTMMMILSFVLLIFFIYLKLKKKNCFNDILFKAFISIIITQVISILVVAKLFEDKKYYLIVTYTLTALTFSVAGIIFAIQFNLNKWSKFTLLICFLAAVLILNCKQYKDTYFWWAKFKNECTDENKFLRKYSDYSIITYNSFSVNKKFALFFGHSFSRVHKEKLKQVYPKAWFYNAHPGKFTLWDDEIDSNQIFINGKVLLVDIKLNEKEINNLKKYGYGVKLLFSNITKAIYNLKKNKDTFKDYYDPLLKIKIQRIKKDNKWMTLLNKKSMENGIPVDSMINNYAKCVIDNSNDCYYDALIKEKIQTIMEDDKWLGILKEKAKLQNVPVDSIIYKDAKWMIDTYGF